MLLDECIIQLKTYFGLLKGLGRHVDYADGKFIDNGKVVSPI